MPRVLPGLRALVGQHDDFLVDLWGVVHDGDAPFDGVREALAELAAREKRVVFVTNSSRSGATVTDHLLERFGLPRAHFHGVVSSGDVSCAALRDRDPELFALLPRAPRCFHHGSAEVVPWLFELGLDFTDDVAEADLVVTTGIYANDEALRAAGELLAPAATRSVPIVCTNPDRIIPSARGSTLGPGAIADVYPGRVFFYGKPHAPIYAAARALLGTERTPVAIGDLLETDIRGAKAAAIPSVLITRTGGAALGDDDLPTRFARASVTPDMLLDRFAY